MPNEKKHGVFHDVVASFISRFYAHRVPHDSAALTYYLLFAMFPLLIVVSNMVGFFSEDIGKMLVHLAPIVPNDVLILIENYLVYVARESSPALLWFSIVFSVYFPMRAANSLLTSVRKAYGMPPPTDFLRYQLKVLLYTLCLVLTLIATLFLAFVGKRFLGFLSGLIFLSDAFIRIWGFLRFVLLALIAFAAIALLYAIAREKRSFRHVWPGILLSFAGWMLSAYFFSIYVENFGNYSAVYGSIEAIVVLLVWLSLMATTLIIGAELNGILAEVQEKRNRLNERS